LAQNAFGQAPTQIAPFGPSLRGNGWAAKPSAVMQSISQDRDGCWVNQEDSQMGKHVMDLLQLIPQGVVLEKEYRRRYDIELPSCGRQSIGELRDP
jgi:hypothetical protein